MRFCAGDIDEYMDIFLDTKATKEAVIQAGNCQNIWLPLRSFTFIMDQILHWEKFATTCSQGIKPETLPPTKGAVAQHAHPVPTCNDPSRPGSF